MTQSTLNLTTHPSRREGMSQKEKLLAILSDGQWRDTPSILREVYRVGDKGIARVAARILDLRNDGHAIESRRKAGAVWEYRLVL